MPDGISSCRREHRPPVLCHFCAIFLPQLAKNLRKLPKLTNATIQTKKARSPITASLQGWSQLTESNRRPAHYEWRGAR